MDPEENMFLVNMQMLCNEMTVNRQYVEKSFHKVYSFYFCRNSKYGYIALLNFVEVWSIALERIHHKSFTCLLVRVIGVILGGEDVWLLLDEGHHLKEEVLALVGHSLAPQVHGEVGLELIIPTFRQLTFDTVPATCIKKQS